MPRCLHRVSQLILSLVVLSATSAMACPDDAVAVRYLRAIDAMNWKLMKSLLAEEARYTDPTMIYYDSPAIDLTGRDDIVAFWESASADSGTSEIGYDITACFETAGYYMVNLDIQITLAGAFWDVNRDQITIPGKVVSVIRVSDGLVTEHHDYVGYAGGDEIVKALQEKYGKLSDQEN